MILKIKSLKKYYLNTLKEIIGKLHKDYEIRFTIGKNVSNLMTNLKYLKKGNNRYS